MGITSVTPENVLVVAESGSHMYGLATPTSDTDYIIIYREPTEVSIVIFQSGLSCVTRGGGGEISLLKVYRELMARNVVTFSLISRVSSPPTELRRYVRVTVYA